MPHEGRILETAGWVAKALRDLGAARMLIEAYPEVALFHCQQALEKVLKAFLVFHDVPFRKTHDLREIGQQCVELDPRLEPIVRMVVPLSVFAWRTRCPDADVEPIPREEAREALATAEDTVAHILDLLPREVQLERKSEPDPNSEEAG